MAKLLEHHDSSFVSLLSHHYPELIPNITALPPEVVQAARATTIVAITFAKGVIIAADRRATIAGHMVVSEDVVKVFQTDGQSAIAIAGTFGPAVKMAKLFKTELEHYEKLEGEPLTLEGRANKLSQMIEMNFPAAVQGMPVMPIFTGYDKAARRGVIFEYDITGGTFIKPHTEPFATSGSGGERAKATFEHFYREGMNKQEAVELVSKALAFAAEKDLATGGKRFIAMSITARGVEEISLSKKGAES
jgi:proteasome beta subunit